MNPRAVQVDVMMSTLSTYLETGSWQTASERLIRSSVEQTGSEYGFFGVVVPGPVLRVLAWHGFSWDAVENRAFYDDILRHSEAAGYLDFPKLDNLFGWVLRHGEALLTNAPRADPRSAGIPAGHPPLDNFLSVPVKTDGVVTGQIGVANRAGGYAQEQLEQLEVLAQLAGVFCKAYLDHQQRLVLEEQLRQAQRMEAVGILVGGIAHEFNNMVTVVKGNADALAPVVASVGRGREELEDLTYAADRLTSLTGQLLAFGRKQVLQPRVVELSEVLERAVPILSRLVGDKVHVQVRLPSAACPVLIDPLQLDHVLANLALNARDAMPRGGELTLAARALPPAEDSGARVELTVTDTGTGMDDRVLSRAFEPFFSTKPKARSPGLGLSTAHGIVHQSGGQIVLASQPGQGTKVTMVFPRATPATP